MKSAMFMVGLLAGGADGARVNVEFLGRSSDAETSFAQFNTKFERSYKAGSKEYEHREGLFKASLARVNAINDKNVKEGRTWKSGVHPFMDWSEAERKHLNGYKPNQRKAGQQSIAALQESSRTRLNTSRPSEFSWQGQGGQLRDQGNCGSCWAISAAEAVEAQLVKQGNSAVQVSAQALVDCVPNPQHCGGSGGCDGATGELAYSFMRDYGIPLESDLPYNAHTGECPMQPLQKWSGTSSRVMVGGWNQLPSNQYDTVLSAIAEQGPVVVAVDANNWFDYDSGVFDGCGKDAILVHAVLLVGYGTEAVADKKTNYWTIQNSWGAKWGEQGHIRLTRHDAEDEWCGVDRKPKEGIACDGGPPEVTVCGMCGLLYDPVIPTGVRLESGAAGSSASAAAPVVEATPIASSSEVTEPTEPAENMVAGSSPGDEPTPAADDAAAPAAPAEDSKAPLSESEKMKQMLFQSP